MTYETGLQVLQRPLPLMTDVKKNEKPQRSSLTFPEFFHFRQPSVKASQ